MCLIFQQHWLQLLKVIFADISIITFHFQCLQFNPELSYRSKIMCLTRSQSTMIIIFFCFVLLVFIRLKRPGKGQRQMCICFSRRTTKFWGKNKGGLRQFFHSYVKMLSCQPYRNSQWWRQKQWFCPKSMTINLMANYLYILIGRKCV